MTNNIEWVPGRYYRMRNGEKAYCLAIVPEEFRKDCPYPIIILREDGWTECLTISGKYSSEGNHAEYDVLSPLIDEPAKLQKIADVEGLGPYIPYNSIKGYQVPTLASFMDLKHKVSELINTGNQLVERENARG